MSFKPVREGCIVAVCVTSLCDITVAECKGFTKIIVLLNIDFTFC